jgi:hypothetical protein
MKNLLKKTLVPALLVIALVQSGVLIKQILDDRKLDQSKYLDVSRENPVCLAEKDGLSAYIITESDEEARAYRGLRALLVFVIPMEISMRDLNSRKDLQQLDCQTGQPIGK